MNALSPIIAAILLEGMKAWNEERRTRFADRFYSILKQLKDAENATGTNRVDYDIEVAEQEKEIFLQAYYEEVKNAKNTDS